MMCLQDYGMFVWDEETRTFWFNFVAEDTLEFKLVGWLIGLAVYNSVILDIHFPPILYKKLNLQTCEEMGFEVSEICLKTQCPHFASTMSSVRFQDRSSKQQN